VGFSAEVIGAGIAINLLHNAYVHFDVDWDHGLLRWLIASPRFHRLHHLDVPEVHHRNLANIYPIWDIMFGTWHGTGHLEGQFGASMAGVPDTDFVRLWLWPFRAWAGMVGRQVQAQ
jgi:sterol desaturase/sphingolipid hydroxylase (fatty acid hydroxylase superfamily)